MTNILTSETKQTNKKHLCENGRRLFLTQKWSLGMYIGPCALQSVSDLTWRCLISSLDLSWAWDSTLSYESDPRAHAPGGSAGLRPRGRTGPQGARVSLKIWRQSSELILATVSFRAVLEQVSETLCSASSLHTQEGILVLIEPSPRPSKLHKTGLYSISANSGHLLNLLYWVDMH